ncbi:MAG: flagellar hook-basal body complex protein FliE [Lachnospiraceae bacterium]|nr:flagellar hook-basal body complex protein FliE [Lachnospiraceae bacterium]
MDNLSALNTLYKSTPVANDSVVRTRLGSSDDNGFASVLSAAKNLITETNAAQVNAQNEEIKFALGYANNTHDLMIAEQKASIALQYTVAVRDRFLQGYNQIMNMQV